MSSLAGARCFLRRDFHVADSGRIEGILVSIFDEVRSTRKGRVWDVYSIENRVGFSVTVNRTNDCLWDIEDELLDMNLLPEDVPDVISIVGSAGTENALNVCQRLVAEIEQVFPVVSGGVRLFH